jgi:N-acetylglucosaminylphosphatidylinositol deacetylase
VGSSTCAVFQMASWARMRNHVTSLSKSKAVRRYVNLLLRILAFVLILSILLQFILAYIVAKDPRILPPALRRAKNLLIVTAHPDDECLFFSPAILGVLDGNPDTTGGLIVLSSGPFLSLFAFVLNMSLDSLQETTMELGKREKWS